MSEPERPPIPAEVVEAALDAWVGFVGPESFRKAMKISVEAAFDKLGLREEREERGDAIIDSSGAMSWTRARLVSDWRPVDADPSATSEGER
jgi:hypothetical protein